MKTALNLALVSFLLLPCMQATAQTTQTIGVGELFRKALSRSKTPPLVNASKNDISKLREQYGSIFIKTSIPGIYAVQGEGMFSTAAQLVTGDGGIVMNSGSLGMQHGASGPRLTESEQESAIRPLMRHFATEKMVQFGSPEVPLRMLVLSAVDCAYCAKLEPALASRNLRYAVIPSALFAENEPLVHRIYCAPDPGKAWLLSLSTGKKPASQDVSCGYDREHFWVLSGLLGGATPRLLFADGDLMRPSSDGPGIKRIQDKLIELERAGIAFE